MTDIPKDPIILMSYINMKLRDSYASLDLLCEDMGIDKDGLISSLAAAGFEYSKENNRFW